MKKSAPIVALAALLSVGNVLADLCAMGPKQELNGNWFCQPVKAIQYSNVGSSGSYRQITSMNSQTGSCEYQMKAFSGPLAPLNEEVSLHFRGPIHIKQLAAYIPSSAKSVKKVRDTNVHQRAHQHVHNRLQAKHHVHAQNKRQEEVTATIDGQIVHWVNNYPGPSPSTCVPPAMVTATIDGQVQTWVNNWFGGGPAPTCTPSDTPAPAPGAAHNPAPQSAAQPPAPAPAKPSEVPLPTEVLMNPSTPVAPQAKVLPAPPAGPGVAQGQQYERIAYYDSVSQTVDNLVFLGNHGGQGSGVFSYAFGASLAYVNSAGTAGASSPQKLADTIIPSGSEITVMLGQPCSANDCGYVQPGSVAYHGFGGADKVFLIEYMMPMDPDTHGGFESDMPAIWMLNAQIPRTTQYGPDTCNCWTSGCGEFDIAESLFEGSTYLKSTLHTNKPGGDSDYIERPTSDTMKLAVVFSSSSSTIHVQVLPADTDFPSTLAASDINKMCQATPDNQVSHFSVT
ncbi:putative TOS1-like glycosyl hydrolase-domain-containing protein [Hyaloscypha sp. PMI_1271]|nr:putative TOS1-like glycosyl hydrolase-domain-containing protein [Hyaloscypha sp. PMI_1271]